LRLSVSTSLNSFPLFFKTVFLQDFLSAGKSGEAMFLHAPETVKVKNLQKGVKKVTTYFSETGRFTDLSCKGSSRCSKADPAKSNIKKQAVEFEFTANGVTQERTMNQYASWGSSTNFREELHYVFS
jgi:hypothetical protein